MKKFGFKEMENIATCTTDESVLFHMYSIGKPVHDYINSIFKIYIQELIVSDLQEATDGDIDSFVDCLGDVDVNLPEDILDFYESHIVEDVTAIIEKANKWR